MNDVIGGRPPAWFRILSVLGLLWSLVGVAMYLMHVGVIEGGEMTEAERALEASVPGWVMAAFALAVFASLLGTLGLVLLKRWAKSLLVLALICVLVQEGWVILVSDARAVHGMIGLVLPLLIIVVAVLLVCLANVGVRRAWLT